MTYINSTSQVYISCKDHTVSNENFELVWNDHQDILITQPQPSLESLPKYYQSEDYISHTDASKNFSDKLYQGVKNVMLQKKVKLINSLVKHSDKSLLDVGAGTGDFLKTAKLKNWKVRGVEPNAQARKLAKEKTINLVEDISLLSSIDTYDVITLWHVLEHIPDLENQLEKFHYLLNSNGYLIIAVPNFKSYDAQHYQEFWAAYDVPRHLWHFSKEGIQRLMKNHNFKLQNTLPLIFDSYYVSLLSEKYKTGSSNYLKAFRVGLTSNLKAKSTKEYSSHIYVFKKY
ncbi:class I SAM-dependent methyltransferase [Mesonia aestuariivivens]|uniref:Class I SAM-dependent methyltransferase n=1 Tax=Mesonia aestuariivivens TaxID=2796128 RepID=A0ABS6W1W5_9FLAO|nr:class I SAM-dependent methyltransferase [Mesonia aestuariivivens]MBW2961547.1 class I SAM-dependent methyltransferase [Mesonia aestuariivivens]